MIKQGVIVSSNVRLFSEYQTYNWTSIGLIAIRETLNELGFNEILPAILSRELEPGAFHSYAVVGDRNRPEVRKLNSGDPESQVSVTGKASYYLPVSHNFEKQQATEHLRRVYCVAPCIRLLQEGEAESRKHLNTFFQIEVELMTESMNDVLNTAEYLITGAARRVAKNIQESEHMMTKESAANIATLCLGEYPRISFAEALELVGVESSRTTDLSFEEDQQLSTMFDRPFWIHDYPKGVRDAVYHENSNGNYDTYDLMLPAGYGELSTGGIRPSRVLKKSLA